MLALEQLLYLFTNKIALAATSLSFIASSTDLFAFTTPAKFTWNTLRLFGLYARFLPDKVAEPSALHEVLASWTGAQFSEESWPRLLQLLRTDLPQLQSLQGHLALPANPLDGLNTLTRALKLTAKLGLNGAALKQLTANDYAGLNAAKDLVYGAIRSKDEEKEWSEIIEPYADKLNEIKRDALVDRILSKEFQLKFKDARELYQFFLLDVEMEGCARISRVLEAISACQL